MNISNSEQLVLVDGSGYIFRAYYALPPMHRSDGLPVNAIFGFCNMLLKLIEDIQSEKGGKVSIAVIFDAARETFRNTIYPEYKANRDETPEGIKIAVPYIEKILNALGICIMVKEGYEADDIIGTLAKKAKNLLREHIEEFQTLMIDTKTEFTIF